MIYHCGVSRKCLVPFTSVQHLYITFYFLVAFLQVIYDQKLQRYVGHINHGPQQIASDDALASESLTFLAVGLKKYFKVPFGYFPIDKIDASQQAQLVKDGISLLSEAGFNVEAVVCDGSFTNQATATALGCDFKSSTLEVESLTLMILTKESRFFLTLVTYLKISETV